MRLYWLKLTGLVLKLDTPIVCILESVFIALMGDFIFKIYLQYKDSKYVLQETECSTLCSLLSRISHF